MSEEASLYERVLGRVAAGGGGPALPPVRPSASVILWRGRAGGGVEVFWIRRADSLPFMGGWYAFPGGGLSRQDAAIEVAGTPRGMGEMPDAAGFPETLRGDDPGPDLAPGIAACALRELFEETGILLSSPSVPSGDLPALAEARHAMLEKNGPGFAETLARFEVTADASRLVWAGRWTTPPFTPVRFDNRFFLLEWPAEEPVQPTVLPGECADGEWIDPAAGLEVWRRGALAAPPILHALEVLAQDGPERGLGRLRDPSETHLGPFRRIELRPGVLLFPVATHTLPPASTTNCWLLGQGEAVLVDPGSPVEAENERLERALAVAREQLGRRVTAIWLTHHHPDHIGGVERLRRTLGVPVLAHPQTAARLAERGMKVDGELADGQRIVLAGSPPMPVLVVHTPGHARGHLCFLEEEGRAALVGDLIAGIGTIVVDPPEGDMDDYLGSLARLAALRPGVLLPGHGPAILHGEQKLREYIDHRLWREGKVLDAWSQGKREPADMLPEVYGDVPQQAWPLAERQILAHLERLRRAGRLE
jgi:glyoxylase-like metal-dependent hydrolase (beta-lactamase superfamily II)/8-oxo-dGTP pyrophosphatase MutT (NUDIX family)